MKTFAILCFFILYISQQGLGQSVIYNKDKEGRIYDFDNRFNFDVAGYFDHDLDKHYGTTLANSIVIVKIDALGAGQLVLYVTQKTIFDIVSCHERNNEFHFILKNVRGEKVEAKITLKNENFYAFWLYNSKDNTSLVLYYRISR
jgi:hypothetical protein